MRGEQPIDRGIALRTFALHRRQVQRADVVQVDIHRESVEIEVEDIERRSALQRETLRKHRVLRDLVQQLQEPQHLLQRIQSDSLLRGEPLQCPDGGQRHRGSGSCGGNNARPNSAASGRPWSPPPTRGALSHRTRRGGPQADPVRRHPHGVGDLDAAGLRRDIHDGTEPHVLVEIDELQEPEGRLLAVRVPPGLPPHSP